MISKSYMTCIFSNYNPEGTVLIIWKNPCHDLLIYFSSNRKIVLLFTHSINQQRRNVQISSPHFWSNSFLFHILKQGEITRFSTLSPTIYHLNLNDKWHTKSNITLFFSKSSNWFSTYNIIFFISAFLLGFANSLNFWNFNQLTLPIILLP